MAQWVSTEDGNLVNLDHMVQIRVERNGTRWYVWATKAAPDAGDLSLGFYGTESEAWAAVWAMHRKAPQHGE